MIRPSMLLHVRRKLIFLYLLRSSSALASTSSHHQHNKHSISGESSKPESLIGHITLRLATRTDVPAIQRCNLATLPENYSSNFYVNHLRQWPDLALVAEHVLPGSDRDESSGPLRRNPFDSFDAGKPQNEIVGYVLGKVEESAMTTVTSTSTSSSIFSKSRVSSDYDSEDYYTNFNERERGTEMMGHVTSLAVLPTFRRKGLAASLMEQLHYHMDEGQGADGVGLHVRVSNIAARKLYCEGMGYGVVDVIRGYYQDGEDAFFMRKNFLKDREHDHDSVDSESSTENNSESNLSRFSLSRMRMNRKRRSSNAGSLSNVWEVGPFRLPRVIVNEQVIEVEASSKVNDMPCPEETNSHIMTGRL